jgi:hypothetical protein
MKLVEFYSNLKEKMIDDIVKENFQTIFNKYKRSNNSNKEAIEAIEKKFFAGERIIINKSNNDHNRNNVGSKRGKQKVGFKRTHSQMKSDENDEDESNVMSNDRNKENNIPMNVQRRNNKPAKKDNNINKDNKNSKKNNIIEDTDDDYNIYGSGNDYDS